MLSVVRVAFVFPTKGACADVSDGQAANLAVLVAWPEGKIFSGTKNSPYKVKMILGNKSCTYILLLMSKW